MLVLLISVVLLHCAFASPFEKRDVSYGELTPSARAAYGHDFEQFFQWWGTSEKKKTNTVQDRLTRLETRQNALYDWLRCESYDESDSDCEQYRNRAESIFGTPSKSGTNTPTRLVPDVVNELSSTPVPTMTTEPATYPTTAPTSLPTEPAPSSTTTTTTTTTPQPPV